MIRGYSSSLWELFVILLIAKYLLNPPFSRIGIYIHVQTSTPTDTIVYIKIQVHFSQFYKSYHVLHNEYRILYKIYIIDIP